MSGKIAAILLAAGRSRRMGRCKQLLPVGEGTVLARCIGTLCSAGIDDIIVVVSPEGNEVAAEAGRFPVRVVVNHEPEGDMASSVTMKPSISYCEHILAEAEYLTKASAGTSRAAFLVDETLKRAYPPP